MTESEEASMLSDGCVKKGWTFMNRLPSKEKKELERGGGGAINSYAFGGTLEDLCLLNMLHDVDEVFYIDVGANHPRRGSVTKLFYERGACGINIEPLPDMFELLEMDRSRDINLNCGCGMESGTMHFRADKGGGSTVVGADAYSDSIMIPIRTLTDIYLEFAQNREVHFCKIDVEGFEKQVLQGIDFTVFRPWIFCVESTRPGTDIPSWEPWEPLLTGNGYQFLGMYSINRYYVDISKTNRINTVDIFSLSKIDLSRVFIAWDNNYYQFGIKAYNAFRKITPTFLRHLIVKMLQKNKLPPKGN